MKITLMILSIIFSATATAGVYKCTDSAGKTVYRANPCAPGHGNIQINIKTGTTTDLTEEQKKLELIGKEQQTKLEQEKLDQQQREQKQAKLKQDAKDESAKTQFLI